MILVLNSIRAFVELLVIPVSFEFSVFPFLIVSTIRFNELIHGCMCLGFDHPQLIMQNRNLLIIAQQIR